MKTRFNFDKTLDLHGYHLEDAIFEIEKNLYSGRYSSIMIIHGHGEGILKKGIRKYLSENYFVKEVENGEDINLPGGSGITLAFL